MKRKIVFFDMDNVLVDFESALYADKIKNLVPKYESVVDGVKRTNYDDIPEIFSYSKPVEGAVEALKAISQKFEVFIISHASWANPVSWSNKLEWVKKYFDSDNVNGTFYKRLVLAQDRDVTTITDSYLVEGVPCHSDSHRSGSNVIYLNKTNGDFRDWSSVVNHLMQQAV
jgi:5'(3')-deoxyribonucleotidase